MAVVVKYNLAGLLSLKKNITPFTNSLTQEISNDIPKKITSNIKRGLSGINDKNALPVNEKSTILGKIRKGKQVKSLIDDGELIKKSNYEIKKINGGYRISVGDIRKNIVKFLSNGVKSNNGIKKYKVMSLDGYQPEWITKKIRNRIKKFLSKYV